MPDAFTGSFSDSSELGRCARRPCRLFGQYAVKLTRGAAPSRFRVAAEGIEMHRPPAQLPPRPGAAELLVERIAACPFAELGGDRVGGDDLRRLIRRAEAPCERAGDAAD